MCLSLQQSSFWSYQIQIQKYLKDNWLTLRPLSFTSVWLRSLMKRSSHYSSKGHRFLLKANLTRWIIVTDKNTQPWGHTCTHQNKCFQLLSVQLQPWLLSDLLTSFFCQKQCSPELEKINLQLVHYWPFEYIDQIWTELGPCCCSTTDWVTLETVCLCFLLTNML